MIDKVMMSVGAFFLLVGGTLLLAAVLVSFVWLIGSAWIATSNKFRRICQAESLIFEYRKNRDKFLAWKKEQEDSMDKPTCSNCFMRGMCKAHGVCENWDGDCQICNLAGEPFLREYCGDCDWEEDEDDGCTDAH